MIEDDFAIPVPAVCVQSGSLIPCARALRRGIAICPRVISINRLTVANDRQFFQRHLPRCVTMRVPAIAVLHCLSVGFIPWQPVISGRQHNSSEARQAAERYWLLALLWPFPFGPISSTYGLLSPCGFRTPLPERDVVQRLR